MIIEEYMKENPDWNINSEFELEFAEPDNSEEARENLEWVLNNCITLTAVAVVVRSYYNGTIDWEIY